MFFLTTIIAAIQPLLMKELLKAISNKQLDPDTGFPYAPAILIIGFQFMQYLCQSWAIRYNFHFGVQTRSALGGLIYNKTLNLNHPPKEI
ncbi:MAG: hypothetical protein EZS28_003473 [Streblomastix strix]|uniref:ABC transmembrane type-1 domain-containing protein n=1 Tax=Streblomastix strix TaxID=222440 RepID=A0A5J4X2L3_9EUKA|nr:MAG: hypothetical protein EZS28_003473 [Streblomastix strix]